MNLSTVPGSAIICWTFFVPMSDPAIVGHFMAIDCSIIMRPSHDWKKSLLEYYDYRFFEMVVWSSVIFQELLRCLDFLRSK